MKKIFAIALALVMVLSMATAFASPCTSGFSWVEDAAATKCGQGSVELVPFVKVNNGCGGYDWEVSTCAGVVASENVYWGIKLTVEANPDMDWWKKATLTLDGTEIADPNWGADFGKKADRAGIDFTGDDSEETQVYYALPKSVAGNWWINAEDDDFSYDKVVFTSVVPETAKAAKVKLCATLSSELKKFKEGVIGDYYVKTLVDGDEGIMLIVDADDAAKVEDPVVGLAANLAAAEAAAKVKWVAAGEDEEDFEFDITLSVLADAMPVDNAVGYIFANGEVAVVGKINNKCSTSFYNAVTSFFGIELGTKMDQDLINKNFGWDDEQKVCLTWSDKAASIVDAECVVAIPKTGDASVLAWLF